MAQTRYTVEVAMTDVAGDYSDPAAGEDFGPIQLDTEEFTRLKLTLDANETVALSSEQLRGGVNDVEFICIAPAGACNVSRVDTDAEEWPIKGGGLFLVHLRAGQVTTITFTDQSGAVNKVKVYVSGRTDL